VVFVERGAAGDAGKIARGGEGFFQGGAFGRAGATGGVGDELHGVVGVSAARPTVYLPVAGGVGGDEAARGRIGTLGGIMRGIDGALERGAADFEELRRPRTAAEERRAQAEFAGLLGGRPGLDVIAG